MYKQKFFATIALLSIVSGCSSHKNPETEIHYYIKKNINYPSAYLPVSFGKLNTDSTRATNDAEYIALSDSIKIYKKLAATDVHDPAQLQFQPATKMSYLDKVFQAENQQYAIINNFKSRPCGFVMKHVFKKQNASGILKLDSLNFHFDSSMHLKQNEDDAKELNKD